jgi:Myb-like DNA-binding domain
MYSELVNLYGRQAWARVAEELGTGRPPGAVMRTWALHCLPRDAPEQSDAALPRSPRPHVGEPARRSGFASQIDRHTRLAVAQLDALAGGAWGSDVEEGTAVDAGDAAAGGSGGGGGGFLAQRLPLPPLLPPGQTQHQQHMQQQQQKHKRRKQHHHLLPPPVTIADDAVKRRLLQLVRQHGRRWRLVASELGMSRKQARVLYLSLVSAAGGATGGWSPAEDLLLLRAVSARGEVWREIAAAGDVPGRSGRQLRDRFREVLDPRLDHGPLSAEELTELAAAVAENAAALGRVSWTALSAERFPRRSAAKLRNVHRLLESTGVRWFDHHTCTHTRAHTRLLSVIPAAAAAAATAAHASTHTLTLLLLLLLLLLRLLRLLLPVCCCSLMCRRSFGGSKRQCSDVWRQSNRPHLSQRCLVVDPLVVLALVNHHTQTPLMSLTQHAWSAAGLTRP